MIQEPNHEGKYQNQQSAQNKGDFPHLLLMIRLGRFVALFSDAAFYQSVVWKQIHSEVTSFMLYETPSRFIAALTRHEYESE